MQLKYLSATIYAKQQPKPLIGDEHSPDGSVGITIDPGNRIGFANMTYTQVMELIEDLHKVATAMRRR